MAGGGFSLSPLETNIRNIVNVILQLMQGRSNAVGEVTLRAGFATTVVTKATHPAAANMSADCEVFYSAKTANAAAVQWSLWTSGQSQGSFVINHVNDAKADKVFSFLIKGNA